jgi:hypothetical protein
MLLSFSSSGFNELSAARDDVLNEDWIIYRMVRSRRLLSLVLVAIGVGRRIQKGNEMRLSN